MVRTLAVVLLSTTVVACGESPTSVTDDSVDILGTSSMELMESRRASWRTGLTPVGELADLEPGQCLVENRRANGRVLTRVRRVRGQQHSAETRLFQLRVKRAGGRFFRATCRIGEMDADVDAMMTAVWPGGRRGGLWRRYRRAATGAPTSGSTTVGAAVVQVAMSSCVQDGICELPGIDVDVSPCDDPFAQDWDGSECHCSLPDDYCDGDEGGDGGDDWPNHDDDGPGSGAGGSSPGDDGPPPEDDECNPDTQQCEEPCEVDPVAADCGPPEGVPEQYYFGLTEAEMRLCYQNPVYCFRTWEAKNDATNAYIATGLPGAEDGPADAWRHAYWTAALVTTTSRQWALDFTTAHESESNNPAATAMDLHNNGRGLEIGEFVLAGHFVTVSQGVWHYYNEGFLQLGLNP